MSGLFGRCGKVCVDHLLLFWEVRWTWRWGWHESMAGSWLMLF